MKKILARRTVLFTILFGEVFVVLAMIFGVNPVEGGVTSDLIRGTPFPLLLLVLTTPAFILAALMDPAGSRFFIAFILSQGLLFWGLGVALHSAFSKIRASENESPRIMICPGCHASYCLEDLPEAICGKCGSRLVE